MATKYQPLVDYIAAQTAVAMTLSFVAIEAIVGGPLPVTMRVDSAAWNGIAHAHVRHLEARGWHARLDRRGRRVHFSRDGEAAHREAIGAPLDDQGAAPRPARARAGYRERPPQDGSRASRYNRLADHLAGMGGAEIALTFAAVEAVVGPLPPAARQAAWWGATPNGGRWYLHTHAWRAAGYVAERPDFKAGTMTFRRVGP